VTERDRRTADGTAGSIEAPEAPPGFVRVPCGKGDCQLLLTQDEYLRGLRRGKWWRRRLALRPRIEGKR